jgi:hypothetical protein
LCLVYVCHHLVEEEDAERRGPQWNGSPVEEAGVAKVVARLLIDFGAFSERQAPSSFPPKAFEEFLLVE